MDGCGHMHQKLESMDSFQKHTPAHQPWLAYNSRAVFELFRNIIYNTYLPYIENYICIVDKLLWYDDI